MGLANGPVTLTAEQIDEFNKKLSKMRHDINNNLALITAALELIRLRPADSERMLATLGEQTPRITKAMGAFTAEFEQTLAIARKL